jgi:hypothetical protein
MPKTPFLHHRSGRKAMGIATLHPSYGLRVSRSRDSFRMHCVICRCNSGMADHDPPYSPVEPSLRAERSNPSCRVKIRKMDCFAALAMTVLYFAYDFDLAARCARAVHEFSRRSLRRHLRCNQAGVRSPKRDADSDVRKNVRSNGECWVAIWIFRFAHLRQGKADAESPPRTMPPSPIRRADAARRTDGANGLVTVRRDGGSRSAPQTCEYPRCGFLLACCCVRSQLAEGY